MEFYGIDVYSPGESDYSYDDESSSLDDFGGAVNRIMDRHRFSIPTTDALKDLPSGGVSLSTRLDKRVSYDDEVAAYGALRNMMLRAVPWLAIADEISCIRSGTLQVARGTETCPSLKDAPGCGPPIVIRHLKSGLIMTFPAYRSPSMDQAMITPHFRRHFTRVKTKPSFAATHQVGVLPLFSAEASEIEVSGQSYSGVLEAIERRVSSLLKANVCLVLTKVECYGTGCSASFLTLPAPNQWNVVCTLPCFFAGGEMSLCDACEAEKLVECAFVDDHDMFAKKFMSDPVSFELQPQGAPCVSWALLPRSRLLYEDIQPVTAGTRVMLRFDVRVEGQAIASPALRQPSIERFVAAFHDAFVDKEILASGAPIGIMLTGKYATDTDFPAPNQPLAALNFLHPTDAAIAQTLRHYCGTVHVVRMLHRRDTTTGTSSLHFLYKYPTQDDVDALLTPIRFESTKVVHYVSQSSWNSTFPPVSFFPTRVCWTEDPTSLSSQWMPIRGSCPTSSFLEVREHIHRAAQCFLALAFIAEFPRADVRNGLAKLVLTDEACMPVLDTPPPQAPLTFRQIPNIANLRYFAVKEGYQGLAEKYTNPAELIEKLQHAFDKPAVTNKRVEKKGWTRK